MHTYITDVDFIAYRKMYTYRHLILLEEVALKGILLFIVFINELLLCMYGMRSLVLLHLNH